MRLTATMRAQSGGTGRVTCPILIAETTRLECVALPPMKEAPLSDRLAVLPRYLFAQTGLDLYRRSFRTGAGGRWTTRSH